jgi:DUF438 domain-containing protein
LLRAIQTAEKDEQPDAADHLRMILERRNLVMFEDLKENPGPP